MTPVSGRTSAIPFCLMLTYSNTKNKTKTKTKVMSEVHCTTGSAKPDWQMEDDWGGNYHISPCVV